ncbi:hypothetical protein Daesc_007950 [Daldinia eschscholtzii]|uniref:GPI anchored protein n=1 Tax=Daldinia eschscholtzii TaxID=292717 RepID=A0AAX6MFM8_9PEZI
MLRLPPSLLVLLLAAATQLRAQQQQHPTAIRKMSLDEGEMFLPEYYAFAPSQLQSRDEEEFLQAKNSSAAIPFHPPYPLHYDYLRRAEARDSGPSLYNRARDILAKLQGRQFACPESTHSCENIDQPNYCCSQGTQCFVVTNAPEAGNVGCCPDGQTTVSVITQTTVTSTTVSASPSASTRIVTVIVTVTPSDGGAPVLSTTTQTTTASASPTSSTSAHSATATGGIPPYRPTSGSSETTTTSPAPAPSSESESESESTSYCPTGFYACLARQGPGGCCRTGRDCSTTSCPAPPPPMTTIISNGATIAVPVSDAQQAATAAGGGETQPTATCASGWFLCGEDAGPVAGCCPSGYTCGTASCTLATTAATATVQKELPNAAAAAAASSRRRGIMDMLVLTWLVLGVSALSMI